MPSCLAAVPSCRKGDLTLSCVRTTQYIVGDALGCLGGDGMTRLEAYMKAWGVMPSAFARRSGVSRAHLLRLRRGEMEPSRRG